MYKDRLELYKQLEAARGSKVLVLVTGDRPGAVTSLSSTYISMFAEHLEKFDDCEKISLYLYTLGGEIMFPWTLVNLIRSYCTKLEVIIPSKCQSAGTLLCLGADNLVMTRRATLGPIDPSINDVFNPTIEIDGERHRQPISVEFVSSYLDLARQTLGINDSPSLAKVLIDLSDKIHPLALGQIFRIRSQIKMLASKLLQMHRNDLHKHDKIIEFLCSDSGSHEYTINRNEAIQLGLNVETPDRHLTSLIMDIYKDIESELELRSLINMRDLWDNKIAFQARRALIESSVFGSHCYKSGVFDTPNSNGEIEFYTYEGWDYEPIDL